MADFLFLVPVGALAAQCLLHVSLLRAFPAHSVNRLFLVSFAFGLCGTFAVDASVGWAAGSWRLWLDRAVPDTLAYTALAYNYFHFFNMSETGRRVRLLIELRLASAGMTEQELLRRYPAWEVVTRRVQRLLRGAQIVEREGRVFRGAGRAMSLAAGGVFLLKRVVFGPAGAGP